MSKTIEELNNEEFNRYIIGERWQEEMRKSRKTLKDAGFAVRQYEQELPDYEEELSLRLKILMRNFENVAEKMSRFINLNEAELNNLKAVCNLKSGSLKELYNSIKIQILVEERAFIEQYWGRGQFSDLKYTEYELYEKMMIYHRGKLKTFDWMIEILKHCKNWKD